MYAACMMAYACAMHEVNINVLFKIMTEDYALLEDDFILSNTANFALFTVLTFP